MLITLQPAIANLIANRARTEGLALNEYVERLLLEDEECRASFDRFCAKYSAFNCE